MTYIDPDSREGLIQIIEKADAVLADPHADWYEKEIHRTKKRCAEDRLSLLMHPGGASGMGMPGLKHLEPAVMRCIKLFDGDETEGKAFLDTQLIRNGVNPETLEGLDWQRLNSVIVGIAEMEKACKGIKPKKPRKDVVLTKKEEPKKMGLFAKIKPAVNSDGEVVAARPPAPPTEEQSEKERICEEARAALGLGFREIKTREHFLAVMRRRTSVLLLYAFTKQEAANELAKLERELAQIDLGYKEALKHYYDQNKPEGKKTLTSIFGDLGEKFQKESFSLGDAPADLQKFEKWLKSRDEDLQKTFKVKVREVYDRDMKSIHDWWEKNGKPDIPGTIKKEEGDRFSIRPSLDTVKEDVTKYVGKFAPSIGNSIGGHSAGPA